MQTTPEEGGDRGRSPGADSRAVVLVVDDDDASREVLELLLGEEGFLVLGAARPSEALARLAEHRAPLDMLLTDVHLPEMSGLELAEKVRALCPTVRVAFVTGAVERPPESLGLFVPKPVDLDALVALVRRELGS